MRSRLPRLRTGYFEIPGTETCLKINGYRLGIRHRAMYDFGRYLSKVPFS